MKFKRNDLAIILLLFSMMTLLSCKSDVEDVNSEAGNATFEFSQIQKISSEALAQDENWPDIKNKFVVNMKTCFIDTVYLQNIVGEDFIVSSQQGEVERTTDANGCIAWKEVVMFDYLQREGFFKISGHVIGDGNYKGRKNFELAVNPWQEKVVDLSYGTVAKLIDINIDKATQDKKLEVESFSVDILRKEFEENKTTLEVEVVTTPLLIRKDINSGNIKENFTGGEFYVDYYLLSRELSSNKRHLLNKVSSIDIVQQDGQIHSRIKFEISAGVDTNSKIEIGMQLRSAKEELDLGIETGILTINSLENKTSGRPIALEQSFDSLIAASRLNSKSLTNHEDSFGFIIDSMTIDNGAESGANLNSDNTERSIDAKFEINITDSLIQADVKNHPFKLEIVDVKQDKVIFSQKKTTLSSNGKIKFRVAIPFKSYEQRYWKEYRVIISGTQAPFEKISKSRIVYINPWLTSGDFGIDSKFGTPPKASSLNIPQIFIDKFSYRFLSNPVNKFKLNKNLDLKYEQVLRLEMAPQLKMDHNFAGNQSGYEKIINGKYKVRFLLLTPKKELNLARRVELDDFYVLTAAESTARAENGYIETNISLPLNFSDMLFFPLKNVVLIEISSLDAETNLRPGYFLGDMLGNQKGKILVESLEKTGIELSAKNIDLAKSIIEKMDVVNQKLNPDTELSDSFLLFKKEFLKRKLSVRTFNHVDLKIERKLIETKFYATEEEFLRNSSLDLSTDEVANFISDPEKMSERMVEGFCHLLYDKNQIVKQWYMNNSIHSSTAMREVKQFGFFYKKCINEPERFLDYKQFNHVRKITQQPTAVNYAPFTYSTSTAYFVSRGQNFTQSKGIRTGSFTQQSLSLSAGPEISLPGFYGSLGYSASMGTRTDIYTADSITESVSSQNRLMDAKNVSFYADEVSVDFRADVKSCVLVTGKLFKEKIPSKYVQAGIAAAVQKKTGDVSQSSHKRIYLCHKHNRELPLTENWYYIEMKEKSNITDSSLMPNKNIHILRGEKNFHDYRMNLIETDKKVIFVPDSKHEVEDSYNKYLKESNSSLEYKEKLDIGFPGLLD